MGKFAIECPKCGNYVIAYNGLRGMVQNTVKCNCGNKINVRAERMSSSVCPECGNTIVYDQGKKHPHCPICKTEISVLNSQKTISFTCPECGLRLSAVEGTPEYVCPVCDRRIDVRREMEKERFSRQNLVSEIKYEGDNRTLIWKHPIEDFNLGSQLLVHESQEAILFRDGRALDLYRSGRYTLEAHNMPLMDQYYKLPTGDTKATFHSEVYFINKAVIMGVKWGLDSKLRVFDTKTGMHFSIGAGGVFNIAVTNARKALLKLVGTMQGLRQDEVLGDFRALIVTEVKSKLSEMIKVQSVSVFEIDANLKQFSEILRGELNTELEEYGLMLQQFYMDRIVTPEDDPEDPMHQAFLDAKEVWSQEYLQRKKKELDVQMRILNAQGDAEIYKIQKAAEAEGYQMQASAEAAEMKMKGYTYQQETARKVGLAAMQNGISGGAAGGMSDLVNMGVALGTMGSVVGMTKDAIQPFAEEGRTLGKTIQQAVNPERGSSEWTCPKCGAIGLTGRFCPECAEPRPVRNAVWICPKCGTGGLTGKFCPECAEPRPAES